MNRGRPKKQIKYVQTTFKLPPELLEAMDRHIEYTTMNRSLFVRQAIIEHLGKIGVTIHVRSDEKCDKTKPE